MQFCALDLGLDPWERLQAGRVKGAFRWNGGAPLNASVTIRGAHSRRFPRRSLRVRLRGKGLPDGPPPGHQVHCLHLNADYIDPTLMRSALSFSLFEAMGVPAPRCRHTALTMSGQFAGVYLALESVDRDFCLRRGWMPGLIYYAVNGNANFRVISPITRMMKVRLEAGYRGAEQGTDMTPLCQMLQAITLSPSRHFRRAVSRWLEVEEYLAWLMVAVFVGNRDGFLHNYALYQAPDTGRFRIIPWDYDATWGINIHGRPARLDRVPVMGWNGLTHRLLEVGRYRRAYREGFLAALGGPLSPEAIDPLIDKMTEVLAPWLCPDSTWRGSESRFLEEVERLKMWTRDRRDLLAEQLRHL